jgi:hypothetical protein
LVKKAPTVIGVSALDLGMAVKGRHHVMKGKSKLSPMPSFTPNSLCTPTRRSSHTHELLHISNEHTARVAQAGREGFPHANEGQLLRDDAIEDD